MLLGCPAADDVAVKQRLGRHEEVSAPDAAAHLPGPRTCDPPMCVVLSREGTSSAAVGNVLRAAWLSSERGSKNTPGVFPAPRVFRNGALRWRR